MRALAARLLSASLLALTVGASVSAQVNPVPAVQQILQRMEDGVVVSPQADETSVTIYPDNLAMITERRRVYLPQGRSTITFEGVTDLIVPQTVVLREFSGFALERNFDYDLMNKAALFENAVGETVSIVRTNRATGEVKRQQATIVSAGTSGNQWQETLNGVIFEIDGQYEALECSGGAETVSFDGVPKQLSSIPQLSIEVDAPEAGEQDVVISYLTSGMGWAADYRVNLKDAATADVFGWLSISNNTAKRFEDVPLAIIAGDLQRVRETRGVAPKRKNFNAMCWPKGSTKTGVKTYLGGPELPPGNSLVGRVSNFSAPQPVAMMEMMAGDEIVVTASKRQATQEDVGDYKLYRVPVPVTVAAYQTKQIAFIDSGNVPTTHRYEFEIYDDLPTQEPISGRLVYDVDNSKDGKLGKPLPKGTMRIFEKTRDDQLFFSGEDRIRNLAVDLPVELRLGEGRNVFVAASRRMIDGDVPVIRFSHDVSNALSAPTTARLTIDDPVLLGLFKNIVSETHASVLNKPGLVWDVSVEANARTEHSFDIPLDRAAIFSPLSRAYLKRFDGVKTTVDNNLEIEYFLKGTAMPADILSYQDRVDTGYVPITVSSRYQLSDKMKSRKEEYRTVKETHTFSNTSAVPQTLVVRDYDLSDESCLLVSDATIKPEGEQLLAWRIILAPGERKTLKYTVTNTCG